MSSGGTYPSQDTAQCLVPSQPVIGQLSPATLSTRHDGAGFSGDDDLWSSRDPCNTRRTSKRTTIKFQPTAATTTAVLRRNIPRESERRGDERERETEARCGLIFMSRLPPRHNLICRRPGHLSRLIVVLTSIIYHITAAVLEYIAVVVEGTGG